MASLFGLLYPSSRLNHDLIRFSPRTRARFVRTGATPQAGSLLFLSLLLSQEPPQDSNPGLQLYESCALPTELRWLVSICLVPAAVLKKTGVPPGERGTLPLELRRRHRNKFLPYRQGAKGVKVDQPGWNVRPSMETPRRLPWTQGDGTLVDVKVSVDIAVHGEMLANHGAACGREGGGQARISQDLQDSLGQRAGGDRGQEACAGAAQEVLVIAEVGRHDRAAGGEIDRDLALDGVVLTTGESGMDQDIGAARQRDNLIGRLAGQNDQSLAVPAEPGTVTLARLGGTADQNATGIGPGLEDPRQCLDQDRHTLVGVDDAADVHDDLVFE